MRIVSMVLPSVVLAACAGAPAAVPATPGDPQAKVQPVEYRSAFEGYRAFVDQDLQDWRRANDEVGAAGGPAEHRGHK